VARNKVTPAQQEQIQNMAKDNKNADEIKDFFQQTYNIKLSSWDIKAAIKGKLADEATPRKGSGKRSKKAAAPVVEEKTGDKFVAIIRSAYNIHKSDFIERVQKALQELGA
jgi:hypothetical protein